jgi:hypothetical protein
LYSNVPHTHTPPRVFPTTAKVQLVAIVNDSGAWAGIP